jgi:hypothetical protein
MFPDEGTDLATQCNLIDLVSSITPQLRIKYSPTSILRGRRGARPHALQLQASGGASKSKRVAACQLPW